MNRKQRRADESADRPVAPRSSVTRGLLMNAVRLHKQGRLPEAEQLYRQILSITPRDAESLHLLGLLMHQMGRFDRAAELIGNALGINAGVALYHASLGNALAEQNRLSEAAACFRRAVALQPDLSEAWNNLGVVLHRQGRLEEAAACFLDALGLRPDDASAHYSLGNVYSDLNRLDDAVGCFRKSVSLRPQFVEAWNNMGDALRKQGQVDEAVTCLRRALSLSPNNLETQSNLGSALQDQGQLDAAAACFRKVLSLQPGRAPAHYNLGNVLQLQDRLAEATACYAQALALEPDYPEAHNNLGSAFIRTAWQLEEAVSCFRRALTLRPHYLEAHYNLGNALRELGWADEATACFRKVVALEPDHAEAHNNLGAVLLGQKRLDEGIACVRTALTLKPGFAAAHNNMGNGAKDQGRMDEAVAHFKTAIELEPDTFGVRSNLLLIQNYLPNQCPETLCDMARQFGALATNQAGQSFSTWRGLTPGQPLRIGLVSGDLRNHPVGYFLEGLLRAADPARIEFIAFPSHRGEDDLTARIKPHLKSWKPIYGLSDGDAARLIHESGVQILLDLAGHTANNRLPVFAWRPAPVQAGWLGYFATTGVAEMDYVIGDPQVAPPCEASHFTETLWPLPETYLCFTPPTQVVEVSSSPAQASGHVTFGCFNNIVKVNDSVIAVWSRVLQRVPGSRLVLKAPQMRDESARDAIRQRFAVHGVTGDRLLVEPPSSRTDYLQAYHGVDIALDPFPYPGGTTSCEALWMGVPVLTKRGDRFLSHAGETFVRQAGLPDWIADDDDAYVSKAVRFATDIDHLATLRRSLRERVLTSPLCDAPRFARNFETAMQGMWERRLAADAPPQPFTRPGKTSHGPAAAAAQNIASSSAIIDPFPALIPR